MRALVAASLLWAGLSVWAPPPVAACSCVLPVDLRDSYERANAALEGTVLAVTEEEPTPVPGDPSVMAMPQTVRYTIGVEHDHKGMLDDTVVVQTASSGGACGFHAEVGDRTARFLHRTDDGGWSSGLCSAFEPARLGAVLGGSLPRTGDERRIGWLGAAAVALLAGMAVAARRASRA